MKAQKRLHYSFHINNSPVLISIIFPLRMTLYLGFAKSLNLEKALRILEFLNDEMAEIKTVPEIKKNAFAVLSLTK